jgi:Ca2+-binding EF-hand superfamily protein
MRTRRLLSPSRLGTIAVLGATCAVLGVVALARQAPAPDAGAPNERGPARLSGFALVAALDRDGQPGLSSAEIAGAADALKTLDRNGDGRVTADELPAPGRGRDGRFGGGPGGFGRGDGPRRGASSNADDLTTTLMAFDRDKDGKLTRAEVPGRFQGLFDRVDANKDAVLTSDEIRAGVPAQGPTGNGERPARRPRGEGDGSRDGRVGEGRRGGPFGPDPLIAALDVNRDGTLSNDEIGNVASVLQPFDRDGNGTVSRDEVFARGGGRGRH